MNQGIALTRPNTLFLLRGLCGFDTNFPDDVDALKAIILAQRGYNPRLEALLAAFQQAMFGCKSKKVDTDQLEFALEDIETQSAFVEAEGQAASLSPRSAKLLKANLGSLPKHLPRVEKVIQTDSLVGAGRSDCHIISEDVSERLDAIPATFRVIRTRYGCRSCDGAVVQPSAKPDVTPGGLPTDATLAHVIVSKYADWVGRTAFELRPVYQALMNNLNILTKLFMDETPAPVLDPGRDKVKTGYFWAMARDGPPLAGDGGHRELPPGVCVTYVPGRFGQYADDILRGFGGVLQVDRYADYNLLGF